MNKNKGSILIFVLVFMLIIAMSVTTLSIVLNLYLKSISLEINQKKAYYLAQSGLNIAPYYFELIPLKNIPLTDEKTWLYNHLAEGFVINQNLDGQIVLFKSTKNFLYSVGLFSNKSRTIIRETFSLTDGKLSLFSWERL